jgi:hypothetical protein
MDLDQSGGRIATAGFGGVKLHEAGSGEVPLLEEQASTRPLSGAEGI